MLLAWHCSVCFSARGCCDDRGHSWVGNSLPRAPASPLQGAGCATGGDCHAALAAPCSTALISVKTLWLVLCHALVVVQMLGASGLGAPACWEWAAFTKPAETAPGGCGQMSMGCRGGTAYPACWQMPWQSWGSSTVASQTCCSFSPGTLEDAQEVLGVNKGA